jgi:mannosyltransferase
LLGSNRDTDRAVLLAFSHASLDIMATAASLSSNPADSSKAHSATDKRSSSSALYGTLLTLVTVLAAFLRLHALTVKSFWLDEGFSIEIARLPWPQFVHTLWFGDANMSLYLLLLRFWLAIGSGEEFIRGLSVLFSVATVPPIFLLGARLFGRHAGLLAALLLAINAYHIRYAQEARSYAMVVFFAVLATWLFTKNLQEPASARWGIYAALCALATYCHFFAALLVPAHAISLLSWRRIEIPWRKFGCSVLAYGAMILPIAIYVVLHTGTSPISWIPPLEPESLLFLGVYFSGVYGGTLLSLDVLAVGIAALGAARVRRSGEHTSDAWGYTLLFSWLVAPVVMVVTVSLVKPIFVPRYLSFCLPALLLLVGVGICRVRPAIFSLGLIVAISLCCVLADIRYYQSDFDMHRQDWRAVTSYVFNHAQPGDAIFFCSPAGVVPFDYYSGQQKSAALRPKTLNEDWPKTGNGQNPSDLKPQDLVFVRGTNLRATPPVGSRVWLVLMFLNGSKEEYDVADAVGKWLSDGRQQVDAQDFTPLKVLLFDRAASGSPPDGRAN